MICHTCKNGTLRPGKTTVTFERNGSIVIFKEVPAAVCDNCGSYSLDSPTAKLVLEKANESMKKGTELEVVRLMAA